MKKSTLIILCFAVTFHLQAQVSEGGMPPSFKSAGVKGTEQVAAHRLAWIDTEVLALSNAENTIPLRYAVIESVDIDIRKQATKTVLTDSGTIWQYRINSPSGRSLQVIFRKYLVPDGAQLYLYNEDYSVVRGAYTDYNITDDLAFITGDFPGDHVIIEYYEPAGVPFEGEIAVGSVGQAYLDILKPKSGNTDNEGFIGINCDEGIPFQNQKHSVCRYTFNDGQYSYLCTGALINTVNNTVTPYFLTAAHCISTAQKASTIVAYFNYEEAACTSVILDPSQTISGSSLLTTGLPSDYTLLQFNKLIPLSYNPFFAGWDAGDTPPENSVSIHHPGGRAKKITVDFDTAGINREAIPWEGGNISPSGTHWAVDFDEGITSGGSSGAPLFDQNKKITGQLHGGSGLDYFGKLSYSWRHPGNGYPSLQSFLDPGLTGVTSVDGFYPATNKPDPQFASGFSNVCLNAPVGLTGFSAFEPLEWTWTFRPGNVQYHDGTTASSQSPEVSFPNDGFYAVTLRVTNSAGDNELSVSNFISAGSVLSLRALPSGLTDSCIASFTGLKLEAFGADAYLWTLSDESDDLFRIENNSVNPVWIKVLDGKTLTKTTVIKVKLTGIQGSCQSTLDISMPLETQTNDSVINARTILPGVSGPFSNSCATAEPGEPVPPITSCTGQLSWCDEYGTGLDIVERSVWFVFTPEVNQTISLFSTGFDNQIAVYSAASASDILSGKYKLEAANDDYTDTDPDPRIISMDVTAGQKYWIQVDGSAGGAVGTFNIHLSILNSIEETVPSGDMIVYPQPAADFVNIESAGFARCSSVSVELADGSGRIVRQETITPDGGRVQLQVGNLAKGIYLARITCDGKVTVVKLMI